MQQITDSGKTFTLVHFVFQTLPERIACMPDCTELHATGNHRAHQRSDDYRAVTCPACKRTDIFKRAADAK